MKFWSIQALRFVAALLVVCVHASHAVFFYNGSCGVLCRGVADVGRCGVDIFFVISGFIITTTGRGLAPGEFIAKRARRLLPLYLLLGAPWVVVLAISKGATWRDWLASVLLWPATDRMTAPALPVGWTLCFEVLFYAAFAAVLWRRRILWLVGAVFVAALVLRPLGAPFQFIGSPLILEFLAGVALTYLPPWRPALLLVPLAAIGLWIGAAYDLPPMNRLGVDELIGRSAWFRVAAIGLPCAVIVWGTLQLRMREGVLTRLGDASYALYLVHVSIATGAAFLFAGVLRLPSAVAIVVTVATSVLFGWRIHVLFEKPMLAWLRRRGRAAGPAETQSAPT